MAAGSSQTVIPVWIRKKTIIILGPAGAGPNSNGLAGPKAIGSCCNDPITVLGPAGARPNSNGVGRTQRH
jgi:hypothetical protein